MPTWLTGIFSTVAGGWQAIALKVAAALLVAALVFGGGYYEGSQNTLKPLAQATVHAVPNALAAQHKQDQKQAAAASVASKAGDASAKAGDAKAKGDVQAIHDKPTVVVQGPPVDNVCPVPTIEPDVLQKLNDAGHQ